ncbi:histidine phosphatase family protein [Hymenobacter sp. BT186]|uniref:Histidine phosphatase family protein n=1 Tax=Hymenobacter telluris TaxID=2816474 RepID=A0A939J9N7_9BACT|nr:phosphoglycerate mutase family protein [Hymenobacter telluris]MBO0359004.1 histidine phosphatase family protein [Hymenobacter telluris]MBW3375030.1 histidine phosphatase family protein [Hymenobacter norwichensis]
MKLVPRPLLWLLGLLILLVGGNCGRAVQRHFDRQIITTIYIVRHAEKDLMPNLADPPLTPAGQQRALALRDSLLRRRPLSAIFSTATTRTRATAEPLAQALNLTIQNYDAKQLPALVARIRRDYTGEKVLVIGHSNTILETVQAFGAARPVPTIGDDEYDYLLEVRMAKDSTLVPTAVARRYGSPSR